MSSEDNSREEEWIEETELTVDEGQTFLRIDKFLVDRLPNASRTRIQNGIKSENILVNEKPVKVNYKVHPGDQIKVVFHRQEENISVQPENISLDILFEDDHLLVINKPAGLVVHPGQGNRTGTLVNGLLYHVQNLPDSPSGIDRPGIVHRIDKLTTGLMVIGKSELALNKLAMQFFHREIERKYWALVWGEPEEEGRIEGNIGRSLKNRKRMQVFPEGDFGKTAATNYKILRKFGYVTLVECKLETGRTHQIRVHFRYIGHPVFADPEYDGDRIWKGTSFSKYKQFVQNCFKIMPRQALHARSLGFKHPATGEFMHFEADLPEDMQTVLNKWEGYVSNRFDSVALSED